MESSATDTQVLQVKDLQWRISTRQGLMVLMERLLVSSGSLTVSLSLSLMCACVSCACYFNALYSFTTNVDMRFLMFSLLVLVRM